MYLTLRDGRLVLQSLTSPVCQIPFDQLPIYQRTGYALR